MIRPYRRAPKPVHIGYVGADGTVTDEAGTVFPSLDFAPSDLTLYADRLTAMHRVIAGEGSAVCWNAVPIRWEAFDHKVILLNDPPEDETALAGLVAFRDWLAGYGARTGSARSSAKSLLRATIERPLYVGGGDLPRLSEVIGGRQMPLVTPGHYSDVALWDISAAYATVLGHQTYGGHWAEVPGDTNETDLPVIAHARVRLPPISPGPLPRRVRKPPDSPTERRLLNTRRAYPSHGRLQGIWSRAELRLAEDLGASVKVDRSWICVDLWNAHRKPFEPWLDAIMAGRELPGYAGRLVKAAGNAMWGSFASYGDRSRLAYGKAGRKHTPERLGFLIDRDPGLAETICAAVRVRLYREAVPLKPLSLHTDGGVFPAGADFGSLPADWRHKGDAARLIYIGPQAYAYGDGDTMTYVVSGVPAEAAADVFYTLCEAVLNYPKRSDPTTAAYLRELQAVFDVEPPP